LARNALAFRIKKENSSSTKMNFAGTTSKSLGLSKSDSINPIMTLTGYCYFEIVSKWDV
jgi:hypothetical protein